MIGQGIGEGVTLVDSAEETATVVRSVLAERGLLAGDAGRAGNERSSDGDHFYVTDSSERFHEVGWRFLGCRIERLELVDLSE